MKVLSVEEAAKRAELNIQTIRRKIREKKLFAYKRPGEKEYRIPEEALNAYLEGQVYLPTDEEKTPS